MAVNNWKDKKYHAWCCGCRAWYHSNRKTDGNLKCCRQRCKYKWHKRKPYQRKKVKRG